MVFLTDHKPAGPMSALRRGTCYHRGFYSLSCWLFVFDDLNLYFRKRFQTPTAKLPEWSQMVGTQVRKEEGWPGGVPWGLIPALSWNAPGQKRGQTGCWCPLEQQFCGIGELHRKALLSSDSVRRPRCPCLAGAKYQLLCSLSQFRPQGAVMICTANHHVA